MPRGRPASPASTTSLLQQRPHGFDELRAVARKLWSIGNNLAIASTDGADFVDAADQDSVFRGFGPGPEQPGLSAGALSMSPGRPSLVRPVEARPGPRLHIWFSSWVCPCRDRGWLH
ncbi:DUF6924 domain-containing protein [Streptomyces sp. NPDC057428]|uniref:DUF6924 domain-containing protein n=1 Tax=Streptomyces sp. NPDC057428 TaxID=3346129 RepID=UPI0036841513